MRLSGTACTTKQCPSAWSQRGEDSQAISRRQFLVKVSVYLGGVALTSLGLSTLPEINTGMNPKPSPEPVDHQSPSSGPLPYYVDLADGTTIHSLIMDCSEPVVTGQSEQINALVGHNFVQGLRKGDRVVVARLTSDPYDPIQLIHSDIDPGKGSEANIWRETPAMVDRRRNDEFLQKYYQALDKTQMPVTQNQTPLVAGLESLSRHALFRTNGNTAIKRRLLLVTDGLEHAEVSAYKTQTLYQKRGRDYVAQHLAALEGVDVTVALINRPKHKAFQNARHWQWLEGHLRNSGAANVQQYLIM